MNRGTKPWKSRVKGPDLTGRERRSGQSDAGEAPAREPFGNRL